MPGWAWYNYTRYYNGAGRYDPIYPDPFRLYFSENQHLPLRLFSMDQIISDLQQQLQVKMENISGDHYHPNVLKFAIQDPKHKESTAEYLGARVIDSLLIGRPFIVDVTGDSVTSGHDNMQESTYAMQTQSRLREFWVKYGVKGSTFQVRNTAEGGGVATNTQGFMPIPMSTENYDYFSLLHDRITEETKNENDAQIESIESIAESKWHSLHSVDSDDSANSKDSSHDEDGDDGDYKKYRFLTAGYPVHDVDVLLWEFRFTDGSATKADRELHVREGALMNAIWGITSPIGGVRVSESCKDWKSLEGQFQDWGNKLGAEKKHKFNEFMPHYADQEAMGLVYIEPDFGMKGACDILQKGTVVSDPKYGDDGELVPGNMYGYTRFV